MSVLLSHFWCNEDRRKNERMALVMENKNETWMRRLPLLAILSVAVIGAFVLRDHLSFEALATHREALIAFRDTNYLLTGTIPMIQ